MKTTKFFSKEIKLGRVFKGLGVSLACFIMLGFISFFGIDSTLNLFDRYSATTLTQKSEVLGVNDEAKLVGTYGDVYPNDPKTEFVWDWERSREDYYLLEKFIENPEYFLPRWKGIVSQTWLLKNQKELKLVCPDLTKELVIAGNYYNCTLSYNGKVLKKDVRMTGSCKDFDKQNDCSAEVAFTVYSNRWGDHNSDEYIVANTWASGSKDWATVFKLNNGKSTKLMFTNGYKSTDKLYISSYSFDLYGKSSTWENEQNFNDEIVFMTMFHEPSMGSDNNVENIFEYWMIKGNNLEFQKKVVDLYREGEEPHWL